MTATYIDFADGSAPARAVVLYDGHCRFCKGQMKNLMRLAKPGALEPLSFQERGVLERFDGLTYEACMEAMHLVQPDGRVYRGMEAAVRAVATRTLGAVALLYYVPGVRQLLDLGYRWIATRRYRLAGRECTDDACAVHFE